MFKPFNALYYIKQNKMRVLVLTILISMTATCYMGGLYITSPLHKNLNTIDIYKNFAVAVINEDAAQSYDIAEYIAKEIHGIGRVMPVRYYTESDDLGGAQFFGSNQFILFNSFFNVPYGAPMPVFRNAGDFASFNEVAEIMPVGTMLGDAQLVMSEMFRVNKNLVIGDMIENAPGSVVGFNQSCELIGTYDSKGYSSFRVDSTYTPDSLLLLREAIYDKSVSINNFNHAITQLKERFPSIQIIDYQYRRDYIYGIFGMSLIFLFGISLMVAIVLTVKINATFAGEYENRTFEFSLYKAIGFSTKEIVAKIIREIILINALGLMLGIALSLSIVFILNEFVLNSLGMALDFFCAEAVISSFLCEIIILTTVISFQVAGIKKCDITQF